MSVETTLFYAVQAGLALAGVGLLWLIAAAARVRWSWGLGVLVFPPLGLVFGIKHRKAAARPLLVIAAGLAVAAAPILYNRWVPVDLGPREAMVGDELHLTLTGWDRRDYSLLAGKTGAVVVQMANPDVTDRTLDYLRGMHRLRELDLGATLVGDAGLGVLEGLPALESLRLRDTRITDAGFARWLAPKEGLKQLDLRGTGVSKETGRAWRTARPGRRLLQ